MMKFVRLSVFFVKSNKCHFFYMWGCLEQIGCMYDWGRGIEED